MRSPLRHLLICMCPVNPMSICALATCASRSLRAVLHLRVSMRSTTAGPHLVQPSLLAHHGKCKRALVPHSAMSHQEFCRQLTVTNESSMSMAANCCCLAMFSREALLSL